MMTTNDSNAETHHEFDDDGAAAFWLHVCNVILVKLIHYKPIKETEKRWPNEFFFLHFSSSFPFSTSPWQIEIVSLRKKEKKNDWPGKDFLPVVHFNSSIHPFITQIHKCSTAYCCCRFYWYCNCHVYIAGITPNSVWKEKLLDLLVIMKTTICGIRAAATVVKKKKKKK